MDRRTRSAIILLALVVIVVAFVLLLQAALEGSEPALVPGDRPGGDSATVVGISDGDTIRVRLEEGGTERVRYIGIDAPELAHPEDGISAECFGEQATDANRVLVAGRDVVLERDMSDRDRHGRLLRHVWVAVDGTWSLVALELVRDGFADARPYRPDTRWDGTLAAAEVDAREVSAGMWGAC